MNADHITPLANAVIISGPHSGRVVALNTDHSENVADDEIAATFSRLAAQWRQETRHVSSVTKMALHPAYQRLIGLGQAALPYILRELRDHGGHWLWALRAITDADPATENADFHAARQAWLDWGRAQGHLINASRSNS
jgi:hypothetical protein